MKELYDVISARHGRLVRKQYAAHASHGMHTAVCNARRDPSSHGQMLQQTHTWSMQEIALLFRGINLREARDTVGGFHLRYL